MKPAVESPYVTFSVSKENARGVQFDPAPN